MSLNLSPSNLTLLYGCSADSQGVSSSLVSRASPVHFGAPAHLPGKDWFAGLIDDVRIYDRVLSPAEVSDLYAATD
jgi:hypothetical protein